MEGYIHPRLRYEESVGNQKNRIFFISTTVRPERINMKKETFYQAVGALITGGHEDLATNLVESAGDLVVTKKSITYWDIGDSRPKRLPKGSKIRTNGIAGSNRLIPASHKGNTIFLDESPYSPEEMQDRFKKRMKEEEPVRKKEILQIKKQRDKRKVGSGAWLHLNRILKDRSKSFKWNYGYLPYKGSKK